MIGAPALLAVDDACQGVPPPPGRALELLSAVNDLVLVLDSEGFVKRVAHAGSGPLAMAAEGWIGRRFADTLCRNSQPIAAELLRELRTKGVAPARSLMHRDASGADLPVLYSAIELGEKGPIFVLGRDLGTVVVMQQRLQEAQQMLERDYRRMRRAESQYQLLFQVASEAAFIVDGETLRIVEANEAAGSMLGVPRAELVGRSALACIDRNARESVEALLEGARASGRISELRARLADAGGVVRVSATPFRSEDATRLLMRLHGVGAEARVAPSGTKMAALVEGLPDAVVLTDRAGTVLETNSAFVSLVELGDEGQAVGRSIDDWLRFPERDLATILAASKAEGNAGALSASLRGSVRGECGGVTDVEVSTVRSSTEERPWIGFILRRSGTRTAVLALDQEPKRLIGRMPLSELVRDTTDLVEKDFIAAALELARGNRTTAAEILGLSRQSLYVKLRRHGFGPGDGDRTALLARG